MIRSLLGTDLGPVYFILRSSYKDLNIKHSLYPVVPKVITICFHCECQQATGVVGWYSGGVGWWYSHRHEHCRDRYSQGVT